MKSIFSETLSGLRREKGLSQRNAAADLGISQALLSHYENDAREPKLEFVVKACNYYDVTADYILGRTKSRVDESVDFKKTIVDILSEMHELKQTEMGYISKLKKLL